MAELQNKIHFLNCKPILNVRDVAASIDYYCNKLGFTKVFSWNDDTGFCKYDKPTFAEVHRGPANIMLSQHESKGTRIYLDLENTEYVELLYQEFKARSALIVEPPKDYPYGMREMLVKDLDDNFLRIGAPLKHEIE